LIVRDITSFAVFLAEGGGRALATEEGHSLQGALCSVMIDSLSSRMHDTLM
jgi:hypothetical protein